MTTKTAKAITHAGDIQPPGREQAERLALDELAAFVGLLDELDEADWGRSTHCDLWSVRDIVAHQGAHVHAGMGVRGFLAQMSPKLTMPYLRRGMNGLDAMNQAQVDRRRSWSHQDLVAEVRDGTPRAIVARRNMGWISRVVRVPAPDYGLMPLEYLLRVIFPRDMWLHRLDIADATDRPFAMSAEHDGVLVMHVVRDLERNVRKLLAGYSVRLTLGGPAGGTWQLGEGSELAVTMGVPDFMRASSGRLAPEERLAVADVSTGDEALKARVLASLVAVY